MAKKKFKDNISAVLEKMEAEQNCSKVSSFMMFEIFEKEKKVK